MTKSDIGGDQDYKPDPGFLDLEHDSAGFGNFLKGFFIYYYDSYRNPRKTQ